MTPGTRVRTRRHGDGTVIDTSDASLGIYHDWWPVWVRLDDPDWPWPMGFETETLEVIG